MTVKIRHLYAVRDGVMCFRNASHYVFDARDLDADGKPPADMSMPVPIDKLDDEVEFDHEPTEEELRAAFPDHKPKPT